MELDLRLLVTVDERVLGLAERLVVALERLAAGGAAPIGRDDALKAMGERVAPVAPLAPLDGLAPIAAEVAAAEAGFVAPAKKKRQYSEEGLARMRENAARMRARRGGKQDSGTTEGASPPVAANGAALPIVQTQAAPAPAAARAQAGGSPAPSIVAPARTVRSGEPSRPVARSFEAIARWAADRNIVMRTLADLPTVNAKAVGLGLPPFVIEGTGA